MSAGIFQEFVNGHAARPDGQEKALMRSVQQVVDATFEACQVRWAGSQRKRTALKGSDLDMIIETSTPVTTGDRKRLRSALEHGLHRSAIIRSHVIRLPAHGSSPRVDLAFANAAFGSRELPDVAEFHDQPSRQLAARALKLWTRGDGFPPVPGWVAESLVVHLDPNGSAANGLQLFRRVVDWLADAATPQALEGVLRPRASPVWSATWSARLPGRLQQLRDRARRLRDGYAPEAWRTTDDVAAWLSR